jgi:uncharacterized tellurite resistance protein B-like protein
MSEKRTGSDVAQDTTTLLLHVALADGNADSNELAKIKQIVAYQAKRFKVDAPEVDVSTVTEESFQAAVQGLASMSKAFKADLLTYATTIAQVDADVEASEVQRIKQISQGLFEGKDAEIALRLAMAKQQVAKASFELGLCQSEGE